MTRTRRVSISSMVTVVVFLVTASGAPAHPLVRETAAVAAGPRVGPAHPVADAVPAGAKNDQYRPRVAFDGTNYLVVWTDWRSIDGVHSTADIFGARVSPSGVVLDVTGIPISTVLGEKFGPDVAFDGTDFLVVWEGMGADGSSDIFGARVSSAGAVLDVPAIPVATGAARQNQAAVAFDGTNLLVVWVTDDGISGTRVSPAGLVLDGAGIPISGETGSGPTLAFDGTDHLVVWSTFAVDNELVGALVSTQGVVGASRTIVADAGAHTDAAIAFDGTNHLLTWTDNPPDDDSGAIRATRVDTAGNALDLTRIELSSADGSAGSPAVAFDGTNLLVTWADGRDGGGVRAARVTRAGALLDAGGVPLSAGVTSSSAVAFDGTAFLVLWTGGTGGSSDVGGTRVTSAATPRGEDFVVSTSANAQTYPALAFDGTNYLAVWADSRHGVAEIFGARMTPAGQRLDGAGFRISAPGPLPAADPDVVFDGTNFLVVWSDNDWEIDHGDVRAARVSREGVVLDPAGIPVSATPTRKWGISIAFDGTNHFVVWLDSTVGVEVRTFGARVSTAGAVIDTTPILIVQRYPLALPAVAFDGANFLVAGVAAHGQIHWTRVAPSGTVLDRHAMTSRPASASDMDIASDGATSLVVWTDERDGTDSIYGTRIDRSGNALDPSGFPISTAPGDQRQPAVVANGPYLVVWRDERRGEREYDVYGARVRGNGQVVERSGFAIATTSAWEALPAVAAGPRDRFGVVTQRYIVDAPYGTQRAFLQTVSPK